MYNIGVREVYFGKAAKSNDTVAYSGSKKLADAINIKIGYTKKNAKVYAGDRLDDEITRFSSGSLTMQQNDIQDEDRSILFGHKQKAAELTGSTELKETNYVDGDEGDFVGIAFYATVRRNKATKYKAVLLKYVKFVDGDEEYKTEEDNVDFLKEEIAGNFYALNDGSYKDQIVVDTQELAVEWIKKKLNIAEGGA